MTVNCLLSPKYDDKRLGSPEYDSKRFVVIGTTVKGLRRSDAGGRERVVTHDKRSGPAPH